MNINSIRSAMFVRNKSVLPNNRSRGNADASLPKKTPPESSYTPQYFNNTIRAEMNSDIKRMVIKIIDKKSDTVIKEIPPTELQQAYARIQRAVKDLEV